MTCHTPIRLSEASHPLAPRRIPVEVQEARLIELAKLRIKRPLTSAEINEQENLERLKYHRIINRDRLAGRGKRERAQS